ncbi:MAG: class I SAM-dependent methyltransferase [Pyrinomonadaceae bacterium]
MAREMTREGVGRIGEIWKRLCRFSFTQRRISRTSLARLCHEMATNEYTLVVHSTDVDHKRHFPNSFIVSKLEHQPANLHTDAYFQDLRLVGDGSFGVILCTGLLEHIPHPQDIVDEFHRILKPGGRLIISASAVFPFHSAPNNFFHFTTNGFRLLFRDWSRFDLLRGSSGPFKTIAILLQRINLQCDVFPPVRPMIELLYHVVPWLDVFVLRQYDNLVRRDERGPVDSIMPATLHAVVIK